MSATISRLAAMSLLVVVAGCSGNDPASDRADTLPESTTPPTQSTPSVEKPAGALTAAQVKAALLTIDDMETGWATFAGPGAAKVSPPACAVVGGWPRISAVTKPAPTAKASAYFTADEAAGRRIFHTVATWATPVVSVMPAYRAAVAECPTYTAGGNRVKVSALSFPKLGDGTFAYRSVAGDATSSYTYDTVAVAVGNSVTWVTVGDYSPIGGDALQSLVETTVDRLASAT